METNKTFVAAGDMPVNTLIAKQQTVVVGMADFCLQWVVAEGACDAAEPTPVSGWLAAGQRTALPVQSVVLLPR